MLLKKSATLSLQEISETQNDKKNIKTIYLHLFSRLWHDFPKDYIRKYRVWKGEMTRNQYNPMMEKSVNHVPAR